jgi:hypothetical protein
MTDKKLVSKQGGGGRVTYISSRSSIGKKKTGGELNEKERENRRHVY